MRIAVWDTYVQRNNGTVMHFDIVVPDTLKDEQRVFEFGKSYLKTKSFDTQNLTSKECKFCHIAVASKVMIENIETKGYDIIEMENCE